MNNKNKTLPEDFERVVKDTISTVQDPERQHDKLDELMEDLLIELGYEEGIKLIRDCERWYA